MTADTMLMAGRGTTDLVEGIRVLGKQLGFWRNGFGYKHACQQLFGDTELKARSMLEIGCGKGLYCLWAKIHGARHVIGLEPLADGHLDSTKCYRDLTTITRALNLEGIEMLPRTIQDYECPPLSFDIVLSVNSINHLDERSCIDLRRSTEAREAYLEIFRCLRTTMKDGSKLIIVDVSNRNFFGDCGIKNPLSPQIEWFKHQAPECWAELLTQAGFANPKITWLSGNWTRRHLGIYYISRIISYFGESTFRLEMSC